MEDKELEYLKYPIGKPQIPLLISREHIEEWIGILKEFPERLTKLVAHLNNDQLNTVYRPEGWTIRQVVHHVADSHHNSYTRFKWTLTESTPVIKAYFEDRWAALEDSESGPVEMSLLHLKGIHGKLVYLIGLLSEEDLEKAFIHPEGDERVPLKENIGIYAWHCEHHYAHIYNLLKRKEWL